MLAENLKHYTYEDYLKFDPDVRCELINGVVYNMGAPTVRHHNISTRLFTRLDSFLKDRQCQAFIAAVDVRLSYAEGDDTVVQPDVFVVCDKYKIDLNGGINGKPDFVIEVLSPSSGKMDKILKYQAYMRAGIEEYWIVDPVHKTVDVNFLENGKYWAIPYGEDDTIPVRTLKGCEINMAEVFEELE